MSEPLEVPATPTRHLMHPRRSHPTAGRPMSNERSRRQLELARHHGRKAILLGIRRATHYMMDPKTPIDAVWVSVFRELCSRCGLPAVSAQAVQSDSRNVTVGVDVSSSEVQEVARTLLRDVLAAEAAESAAVEVDGGA